MKGVSKIGRKKPGEYYPKDWNKTGQRCKEVLNAFRCESCGTKGSRENPLERHHIIPTTRGGSNAYLNLKILCLVCHERTHRR